PGPNFSKAIQDWQLNNDGTRKVPTGTNQNPRELISYEGAGYSTAAGLAAGPDGIYFTTLYPDTDSNPLDRGAQVLRVVYTGVATTSGQTQGGTSFGNQPLSLEPI